MKLDFNIVDGPSQDLYIYDVLFGEQFTLREFLQHLQEQRKDEWGEIYLNEITRHTSKNQLCEYSHGEIIALNQQLFDDYADKVVKVINARGGYSNINYVVLIDDREIILMREQIDGLKHDLTYANERIRGLTDFIKEKDVEIGSLKDAKLSLEQQIAGMKKASLWQRIRGWKEYII